MMLKFPPLSLTVRRSFSSCHVRSSGHNKWSKIKQKKGANDAQKGAIFGKANRDIIIAVRSGGSIDPAKNLQLAAVLKRAKELDVPRENIEKALARASQGKEKGGDGFTYEALAYNSIGLIIECMTDNSNRTIHSLREILNSYNARAAPVKFMFQRKGFVSLTVDKTEADVDSVVDKLIDIALANGADDFESVEKDTNFHIEFTCQPNGLTKLTTGLSDQGLIAGNMQASELIYSPLEPSPESSDEVQSNLRSLIDDLEANEDVLRVWTSLDSN